MRIFFIVISIIGLILTIVPAVLVFYARIGWNAYTNAMILGMILWFVFAPLWMGKHKKVA